MRLRDGARVAVIGAGPSGIVAAKHALKAGFDVAVFEPNRAQVGAGRITFAVSGLDSLLERLAAEASSTSRDHSNGVRHVKVPDTDGNAIAFAEPPDAG